MDFDLPEGTSVDSEQLKLWLRGGRGGRAAAGPGVGPGGGFGSAFGGGGAGVGSGGIGGESSQTPRSLLLRRMMAAAQRQPASYESGGPVVGGPPGTDTVPAMVDNGEGVFNRVAMTTPGMGKFMAVLNALAALELGPDDAPAAPPMAPPADGDGMDSEGADDIDPEGYFLGGLIDKIPVVGKPLHKAASIAAPLALMAMGVPAPLAAAGANFAMEGNGDDLGGSLGNAGVAGGKAALVPGQVDDEGSAGTGLFGRLAGHYAYGGYTGAPAWKAPGAAPVGPWANGGTGTPKPNAFNTPPPNTGNQWLQDQAKQAGVFDPNGNRAALGAAQSSLRAKGLAQERGDINSLAVSGLTDPSLYASAMLQQRHERGLQEGSDLAQMQAGFAKDAGDFAQGMYQSDSDHAWQNYLDFLNMERQKQLKKTKGK